MVCMKVQSSRDATYGHENLSYRESSHPKLTSDYTLYKEAISVKGLLGKKRQKEFKGVGKGGKREDKAIFKTLNIFFLLRGYMWSCQSLLSLFYRLLTLGVKAVQCCNVSAMDISCLSVVRMVKIHFNSKGTLKKSTFFMLFDNLRCPPLLKTAQHALPCTHR